MISTMRREEILADPDSASDEECREYLRERSELLKVEPFLQSHQMKIFTILYERRGHTVSRDEIREMIYGDDSAMFSTNVIDVQISRIRALKLDGFEIQTVRFQGYRLRRTNDAG